MKSGIALQMAEAFEADKTPLEDTYYKGDINKLGKIDWFIPDEHPNLIVVNAYTQFKYGTNHKDGVDKPLDYEALALCMRKINHMFKGKHIGLPKIGCGLAGGIWDRSKISPLRQIKLLGFYKDDVKTIIENELKDCQVTIVEYKK
jgi:O-acetyl-ADP-ribose deacetylase (regulator of RNase III)